MQDQQKSHFDRFLRPILASRFFTISAIVHLLIILLFGTKTLYDKYVEPPDFTSTGDGAVSSDAPAAPPAPPPEATLPPSDPTANTPPMPSQELTAIATMNPAAASFNVPMPTMAPPTISNNMSAQSSQSMSTASSVSLPGQMSGRSGGSRESTGKRYGEKSAAEQAVLRALRWLQTQQDTTNGTWGSNDFKEAFTGLALLCYLGHGETPEGSHEFGVVVNNAINALIAEGNKHDGRFTGRDDFGDQKDAYKHAICTYALCEAYTMTKDKRLEPLVREAVDYIIKGQRPDGGWAYRYDLTPDTPNDPQSDTSVSGWQIQALKAAHLTGLSGFEKVVPTLNKAMRNLDRVFDPSAGTFGYRKPSEGNPPHSLTGVGVLSKLFWLGRPDRTVTAGIKYIESKDLSYTSPDCNLYGWYYDTQACFQAQGTAWDWWNSRFQDILCNQQSPDGSWPPTQGTEIGELPTKPGGDGPLYRTTLCCLMLEVFYRYLPTTQEDAVGSSQQVQGL